MKYVWRGLSLVSLCTIVLMCVGMCVRCVRGPEAVPEPVVTIPAKQVGRMRGVTRVKPKPKVRYVDQLVLNYAYNLTHHVTGYTRFSDAGDPWRKTYASVNFLPGSKRKDLYDPHKPFRKEWTKVLDTDVAVAVPWKWRHLFEERIELPTGYWYHRYRIWAEGYPSKGEEVYAVPRDRCPLDRFDFFFSTTKHGRSPTQRAYDFTDKSKTFEVWRYDWVKVPVREGE